MGTIASTARIGEKPFASWKKRGACASGAVCAKAMMTPAKSATVTARTWIAASSALVQLAPDQREGDQRRDAGGQDHQPDGEVEASADGDERGRPGQQGVGPQDVADDAQARRVDRTIDDCGSHRRARSRATRAAAPARTNEGQVPTDCANRFTRVAAMPTPPP